MTRSTLVTSEMLSDMAARSRVWNLAANLKAPPIVVSKRMTLTPSLSETQSKGLVPISLGTLAQEIKLVDVRSQIDSSKITILGFRVTLMLSGTGPTRISWLGLPKRINDAESTTGENVTGTEYATRILKISKSVLYAETGTYSPHGKSMGKSELESTLPTEMSETSLSSCNSSRVSIDATEIRTEGIPTAVRIASDAQGFTRLRLDGSQIDLFTAETNTAFKTQFPWISKSELDPILGISESPKDTPGDATDLVFGYVLIDALDPASLSSPSVKAIVQVSLASDIVDL